jgi:hypothetical protein
MTGSEGESRMRITESGRKVPTFSGLHHSEEAKQKISKANAGKRKPKESVEAQSKVWRVVKPLFMRDALVGEVVEITGFTREQVRNAFYSRTNRPDWNKLDEERYYSPEKQQERRRRSHEGIPRKAQDRPQPTNDELHTRQFARDLLVNGFITDNLWYWDRLGMLYQHARRSLPTKFAQRIKVEAFFTASLHLASGRSDVFDEYSRIAQESEISKGEEETFIEGVLARAAIFRRPTQ